MGFGARFLAFALLAGFTFFIPFFLLAGAARFAFLDFFTFVVVFRFFAMISLSIGSTKKPRGERAHTVATYQPHAVDETLQSRRVHSKCFSSRLRRG